MKSSRQRPVALLMVAAVAAAVVASFAIAQADPSPAAPQLDGRVLVALGDGAGRGGPPVLQVSLRTASGVVPLRVARSQQAQMAALAGRQVRVRGTRTRGAFNVARLAPVSPRRVARAAIAPLVAAPRALRVAVVLMHLPGTSNEDITRGQSQTLFFAHRARPSALVAPSVADWFSQVSGRKTTVSGAVFGYYDSNLPANDCNLSDWLRAAAQVAGRDGYSPAKFTNLVVVTPAHQCPFAGIGRVGSSGVYIDGHLDPATVERELGHNLGLLNAGAYSCSPPTPSCLADFGDPADIMGNTGSDDYSAPHKNMLGWIPRTAVKTLTSGTRTYALTASDHPLDAQSTALIYVPRPDGTMYAIERQGTNDSGVWVRIVGPTGTDDTELPLVRPLAAGETYVDPAGAMTVQSLSGTQSVRVCAGDCGHRNPTPTSVTPAPASTSTTSTSPPTSTTTTAAPLPPAPPSTGVASAASREILWAGCPDILSVTDAQLDAWRAEGIGGFVCKLQYLVGMGGAQEFTADPNAPLTGARYALQRQIRDSGIVARAAARGIKLWIGIDLANYYNPTTPLEEWFNDAVWASELPKLGDLAGAAHTLGFAGLAFDEEQYSGGTWSWDYSGNTHTEAEVRSEVRSRGAQMMSTIVQAFPDIDVLDYGAYFPESWAELVQQQVNHVPNAYATSVQTNLWDGLTSVPGYDAIRFMDATFYKSAHLPNATWDNAMTYNINGLMAYFSRNFGNWSYAAGRVDIAPFAWIDGDVANEGLFTAPRDPGYVADQLAAFRRWGMGGAFSIYSYAPLGAFDYAPYVAGMQAASIPGPIVNQPPGIVANTVQRTGGSVVASGTATDDMAVRSVRWQAGANTGTAPLTWVVTGGSWSTGYQWHMNWTATVPASPGQAITFTAEDSTGLTTTVSVSAP